MKKIFSTNLKDGLKSENETGSLDIQMARISLSNQGWGKSVYLPHGWMVKKKHSDHSGLYYLTNQFTMFSKRSQVEKYLKECNAGALEVFRQNYEMIADRPLKDIKEVSEKISPAFQDLKWQEDITLPEGWKISPYQIKKGKFVGDKHNR